MSIESIYQLAGVGIFLSVCIGGYLKWLRPHFVFRRRLMDKLMGNDGKNGLPRVLSIFDQNEEMLDHLRGQDIQLDALVREFPPNGIPTRSAVDNIARDLRKLQRREDQRWMALNAALEAQKIIVPPVQVDA